MKRSLAACVLFAAALLLVPASVMADMKPNNHTGLFLGIGGGIGSLSVDIEGYGDFDNSESGGAGIFFIGLALSPNMLLGLEGDGWVKNYEFEGTSAEATWTFTNATAALYLYLTDNLFIKGGPSLTRADLEISDGSGTTANFKEDGWGFMVGGGLEMRLGEKFSLVPSGQYLYQKFEESNFDTPVEFETNYWSITLSAAWFW